jgi:electron transfer flavoprotein alpha subunit
MSTTPRPPGAPLRVVSLAKQIPVAESFRLEHGRLVRIGLEVEMNAYCRRAVAQGVTLARETGGRCTVVTLGPTPAEDVLREAIAWGADDGLHLCDAAFAGSDTLATARALAAAIATLGPPDLVLVGRNTLDGETGQVGPELAELLDLPFAGGVRALEDRGTSLHLELENDDGMQEADIDLPAVLSVAERLCDPCKVDPAGRAAVEADRITVMTAAELGPGPWGDAGSPTVVGATRPMEHSRAQHVLQGPVAEQVESAVRELLRRGALTPVDASASSGAATTTGTDAPVPGRVVAVLAEPGRPKVCAELVGAATRLGAAVHVLWPGTGEVDPAASAGADLVVVLKGSCVAEDVARALAGYLEEQSPWALLAPSTAFGREVAGRVAAATGSGLVGDAMELDEVDARLVAAKPAFAGALLADIGCRSAMQMVTVRPGVLPAPDPDFEAPLPPSRRVPVATRGRIRLGAEHRNDDMETLARAEVVIGVGTGVPPDEYERLSTLAALLGAELAATRKVTDKGWAPRARQVGITGRSIAPRLYIAIGLSGKFNHMVGVRAAETVLAINQDASAPVFEHCDVGITADWHEAVPVLEEALRRAAS